MSVLRSKYIFALLVTALSSVLLILSAIPLNPCFHFFQVPINTCKMGSCSSCSEEKSPMVPNPDPKQY